MSHTRRQFLSKSGLLLGAAACQPLRARAQVSSDAQRPQLFQGFQIGDVRADRALIWARSDRAARLRVEWDNDEQFRKPRVVMGPVALAANDFTARVELTGLPSDRELFVRVSFAGGGASEALAGQFRSAPATRRNVRFLWSGDTAGQGFGINPELGGMRIYETMRARQPDFFLHSGDTIYADNPIPAELTVEGGRIWRNLVTPEKSKVAETLAEFRGAYKYNLLDENVRRFNMQVPQLWQWDDHEVINNWSASKELAQDTRYGVKSLQLLAARARRAFLEYAPLASSERVYRHIPYGPLLDVFIIDMRSYRGPNTYNLQAAAGADTALLGAGQLRWLQRSLLASRATWKVIAADMPLGLVVPDGLDTSARARFEGAANGDGKPLGRELEIAELLRFIKHEGIGNIVWLTADVHYTAAHYYDPAKAQFSDFDPFWEFVSGPLNAGSFGPNPLDDTFGPQVMFQKVPPAPNTSPLAGFQFFGEVAIDGASGNLSVTLRDASDRALWSRTLQART